MPINKACTRCRLHETTTNVCVYGVGSARSKIMLIAEAPGEDEELTGIPFQGRAGEVLNRQLRKVGIDRADIYITNINKCRPPGNRTPKDDEAAACFIYLAEEIAEINPAVIVVMGGSALKALTGKKAVGTSRGVVLQAKPQMRIDCPIIATYHPAAVLHRFDQTTLDNICADLRTAQRMAGVEPEFNPQVSQAAVSLPSHKKALLTPMRSEGTVQRVLQALQNTMQTSLVSVDCEWTGERSTTEEKFKIRWPWVQGSELYSIALSVRSLSGVMSVGIATPFTEDELYALRSFLYGKLCVFHNAMGDLIWMRDLELQITLGGDTQVLGYLLDEEVSHKLEDMCSSRLGMKPWKGPLWPKRPDDRDETAWTTLLEYNTTDTYGTLLLEENLRAELRNRRTDEREGIQKLYTKLMLKAIPSFVRMAHNGMPIDAELLHQRLRETLKKIEVATTKLAEIIGCSPKRAEDIAMSSQQTVALFRRLGLQVSDARADTLKYVDHPAASLISEIKSLRKYTGTYAEPWEKMIEEQTDDEPLLHTLYRITTVRTGRTSAEVRYGASIQLVYRGDLLRPTVRARPGYKIISLDYSNVEMRVAATIANERNMIALFKENADLHKATAAYVNSMQKMGNVSLPAWWPKRHEYMSAVTTEERQAAKGINFGFLYMMFEDKFILYAKNTYGVDFTDEEAHIAREGYFSLFPDLVTWHEATKDIVARGYIVTPMGFVRRGLTERTKAANTPVQTTASYITMLAQSEIDRAIEAGGMPPAKLGAFVHDSISLITRDEHVEEVTERATWFMEHPPLERFNFELKVPLMVEAKVKEDRSWG